MDACYLISFRCIFCLPKLRCQMASMVSMEQKTAPSSQVFAPHQSRDPPSRVKASVSTSQVNRCWPSAARLLLRPLDYENVSFRRNICELFHSKRGFLVEMSTECVLQNTALTEKNTCLYFERQKTLEILHHRNGHWLFTRMMSN